MMLDLDNTNAILHIDSDKQLNMIANWSELFKEGREKAKTISLPQNYTKKYSLVLICGMGGSAIAGDYLKAICDSIVDIPVLINRSYHLPNFVNTQTLIICISYSGNTEETVSMLTEAIKNHLDIIALSSSGIIAKIAKQQGFPYIPIRPNLVPRAALAFIYGSLLSLFENMQLLDNLEMHISEVVNILEQQALEYQPQRPTLDNPAKQLAKILYGSIPVIVGHTFLAPVAYRAKCQFNENSKILAIAETIPEHDHNTIVALDNPTKKKLNDIVYIFLRDPDEEMAIKVRMDETVALTKNHTDKVLELYAEGSKPIAKQMYLTYLLDFVSIYLGLLYGANPTDTPSIDHLKKVLKTKLNLVERLTHDFETTDGKIYRD
ncbi:MAG: bifunctional phosphoglucose/phosphomannose isomerase [Candidatus Heimdallarchaeaceae archaeon]